VKGHFEILEDTLLGSWLPAFTKRPKRRVISAPKFYFSDVGVVNVLAKRGALQPGGELFGKAFENWVLHELRAGNAYLDTRAELSYWRLASGIEVDFIIGNMAVAIEAKATGRLTADHFKGLRHLHEDHPRARRAIVCLEPIRRTTADGIEVLPARTFVEEVFGLLST
jgi:predicted AAA+ superfamily ATPase